MGVRKFIQAVVGLSIVALGITLSIAAEGPDPWGLFILGLNSHLPLSLGMTSQLGGLLLILLNLFWGKRRPGLATILSMVLVGVFLDLFKDLLALGDGYDIIRKAVLLAAAIPTLALGISVYVNAGLGEGPVEGTMFVLSNKLKVSVGVAKVTQDLSFLALAALLGRAPMWGTVFSALGVGPLTQLFLRLLEKMKKAPEAP